MPTDHTVTTMRRRHRLITALGALFVGSTLVAVPAIGQDGPDPVPFEDIYAPTGSPDRVILTPTAKPATSQAVSWRTSVDVTTPIVEVAEATPGPEFKEDDVVMVNGETAGTVDEPDYYPMNFHTAVIDGLAPDTTYLYRVGDGSDHRANWSEWYEFTTPTEGPSDFSFVYLGDSQYDHKEHASRVFRRALLDRPDADLFLDTGDLINYGDRDYEFAEWFHAHGSRTGSINQLATPGNHEYWDHGANNTLTPYWTTQFNFPDNGPKAPADASDDELEIYAMLDQNNVHYVDYQGVRFISLDSNGYQMLQESWDPELEQRQRWWNIQADWLDDVLTENPNEWTVIYHHHPVFSSTAGRDNDDLRDAWLPVFLEHDVDLVFSGHDHNYVRGVVPSRRTAASPSETDESSTNARPTDGTVFTTSISGPDVRPIVEDVWHDNGAEIIATAENTQLYQLIDVSGRELRYEARDALGDLVDGFRIHKTPRGEKMITDLTDE